MKFLKKMRIKTQILIAVSCFLLIMLSIITSMYIQTSRIVVDNSKLYAEETVRKFQNGISRGYDEIGQIMLNLGFDPAIQKYMVLNDPTVAYEMSKEVDRKMISLKAGRTGIEDIVILGSSGSKYSLNGGIDYVHNLREDIIQSNGMYVSGLKKYYYNQIKIDCLVFAQKIYSNNLTDGTNGTQIGEIAVIVNVNAMFFDKEASKTPAGVVFYLVDRFGAVFPDNRSSDVRTVLQQSFTRIEDQMPFKETIGKAEGTVQIHPLDQIQARMVSFVPDGPLLSALSSVRTKTILILILALLFLALPFSVIVNNILHPIQILVKFINTIKAGNLKDLKTKLRLEGNVEMTVVADRFNSMLSEIDSLTSKLVETTTHLLAAEIEKEKAASAYLRSQINPHFLYNTLESIKGLALDKGVPQIADIAKALGKLFHYSIKGPGVVTLEQELKAVKSYLFLQLIRFEGRFEVAYEFTDEALKTTVMKMILQPLVENAIFHGLEPKTTKGRLVLSGGVDEHRVLIIRIADDGIGVDEARLSHIRQRLSGAVDLHGQGSGDEADGYEGIGISNTHNRLKLAYGPAYGLTFESESGIGTCITLKMPGHHIHPGGDTDV
ncbi:sensor histidine kinase [Cohnella soli]|uniref:histidine kinase n=1 Tax=Cohnella soli TaxID=425005 RepID=A0ABW0I2Y8_9BACL